MYVKKDATIHYFCSRRCEKNLLKLGRTPRLTKFTVAAKKTKEQMMAALAHEKAKHSGEHAAEAPAKKPAVKKTAKPKKEAA